MPLAIHPAETDLLLPLPPDGEQWDPYTIHTHYFGLSVPEAAIGGFLYVRYMPAFPLCQGGVCFFQGLENNSVLDMEHLNYEMTMPWPEIDGNTITTHNGLRIEFLTPGESARITYESRDGQTRLDVTQTAMTPLMARGHIVPGEEDRHDPTRDSGGTEQYMHCVGELVLNGDRYDVDCYGPRDRSWNQIRVETQGGPRPIPPIGWSPMCFDDNYIFNQISFEPVDTHPAWEGLYDIPDGAKTHHFAWLYTGGDSVKEVRRVRRNVLEYHPTVHAAVRQEILAEDEDGHTHRFEGHAIAMSPIPAWPNAGFADSVYRWENEQGQVTHATYQELWADRYHRYKHAVALAATKA